MTALIWRLEWCYSHPTTATRLPAAAPPGAPPIAAPEPMAAPLTIDDFELLKVIGQGSFGKVLQVGSQKYY
jgi:hypothetical protein